MITIQAIKKDSPAAKIGTQPGDVLISLNDQAVNDFLDYQFLQAEEYLDVHIQRNGQDLYSPLEKEFHVDMGLVFDDPKIRGCANNCIFCFIDQNPKNMRKPIYFHDEDYRYSFLYGNFITLTNLRQKELDRIVNQKLSPLYVSIHATDSLIRKKIFRHKKNDHLIEKLTFLTDHNIQLHTQIVLVPGINDGKILEKTLYDLYAFREQVLSVAIVPVGLTKHRNNLPSLTSVDRKYAQQIVKKSKSWASIYRNIEGDSFVTIADEFFILAGNSLPKADYYGPFYQIENGVGLTRQMLDNFEAEKKTFPQGIKFTKSVLFVSGKLIKPLLEEKIAPELNKINNLICDFIGIKNKFYGSSVTISGLLTGQDIIAQVDDIAADYDVLVLPPRCLNEQGKLLDDLTPKDLENQLGTPVFNATNSFMEIINYVNQ